MVNGDPANFHPEKLGQPAHVLIEPDTSILKSYDFHHGAQAAVFEDLSEGDANSEYTAAQERRCR